MLFSPSRLWFRLAAASAVVSLLTLTGLVVATILIEANADIRFRNALSEQDLVLLQDLEARVAASETAIGRIYAASRGTQLTELEELVVFSGLFALVSFVAATGVFAYLAGQITRPVSSVAATARKIVEGDLGARASGPMPSRFSGEISQLVQDFNSLAATMQAHDRRLKQEAAAIAHELRTPLTVLMGRLHGLCDGLFEPTPEEHARLLRQAKALANLIDDLRTVSLATAGQLALNPEPVDLSAVAAEVIDQFANDIEKSQVALHLDLQAAPALADPNRLRQAIGNLIANALRYAGEWGELRIESGRQGDWAQVRVLDRGPGLPAGQAPALFEPFTRGDPSRSRDSGGSGLGLAVVAAVASSHGGEVVAANRDYGGAVFTLRIPQAPIESSSLTPTISALRIR